MFMSDLLSPMFALFESRNTAFRDGSTFKADADTPIVQLNIAPSTTYDVAIIISVPVIPTMAATTSGDGTTIPPIISETQDYWEYNEL
jgi:hypothetical protein